MASAVRNRWIATVFPERALYLAQVLLQIAFSNANTQIGEALQTSEGGFVLWLVVSCELGRSFSAHRS